MPKSMANAVASSVTITTPMFSVSIQLESIISGSLSKDVDGQYNYSTCDNESKSRATFLFSN